MPALGALTQAWSAAEAALPLGWQVSGLYRFDDLWIALGEGPAFDDYTSGSGPYAEQALRRLGDRLRERRGTISAQTADGGRAAPKALSAGRGRRRRLDRIAGIQLDFG